MATDMKSELIVSESSQQQSTHVLEKPARCLMVTCCWGHHHLQQNHISAGHNVFLQVNYYFIQLDYENYAHEIMDLGRTWLIRRTYSTLPQSSVKF